MNQDFGFSATHVDFFRNSTSTLDSRTPVAYTKLYTNFVRHMVVAVEILPHPVQGVEPDYVTTFPAPLYNENTYLKDRLFTLPETYHPLAAPSDIEWFNYDHSRKTWIYHVRTGEAHRRLADNSLIEPLSYETVEFTEAEIAAKYLRTAGDPIPAA